MIFKKHFCHLLICIVLVSCSEKKESIGDTQKPQDFENLVSFKLDSILRIPIDQYTPYRTYNSQYVQEEGGSKELLLWSNRAINAIEIYDLNLGKLEKRLKVKKEGPEGIGGKLTGFQYISKDSLLVTNNKRYEFYLVNSKGNAYQKYSTFPDKSEKEISVPVVYDYRPIMYAKPVVYIVAKPDKDYNKKGWWSGDLLLELNLESKKYKYELPGPQKFDEKVHGAFFSHHSMLYNGEEIIVSFPIHSDILLFNPKRNNVQWKYAGSKYFSVIPSWENPAAGKSEKFYIESNSYREILYDKWNKLYYRLAYRKVEYLDKNNRRVNWDYKIPSIIILNEQFEKVGEYDLPENTYYTRNTFITPAGLFISINHDENKKANENFLSFQLFKPTFDSL
ncbi:hypothetical protein GCM10011506_35490 [Marivirga lumbricoides]|uniref:DUF4221 domain-containing protein n=1 Tax=Marivirga lumbricoides TaxID=1046115 RepID=A0ABQ1N0Y0_9BACT|nr:hypothetical protein GCM10011506_35490 [Marivirga lumbricoides]